MINTNHDPSSKRKSPLKRVKLVKVKVDVCHSGKVAGKVKVEAGALPVNLLPYLAEA
jgi:hypothetical protein